MSQIISAIYENGILRPLEPLKLQQRQLIQIQILPDEAADKTEQAVRHLLELGLAKPPRGCSDVAPVPEAERLRLSDVFGKASDKPLSEIIIEERGEECNPSGYWGGTQKIPP